MTAAPAPASNPPITLEQAREVIRIRDGLWGFARKRFCRFARPRSAEELVELLHKTRERLAEARARAARPITRQEIDKMRPVLIKWRGRPEADDESAFEEIIKEREREVAALEADADPFRAASAPLDRRSYPRRQWERMRAAGLTRDDKIIDPADALLFLQVIPALEADNIPETVAEIVAAEQAARSAGKRSAVERLRRAALKAAPAEAIAKIESVFRLLRSSPTGRAQYALLEEYVTQGAQALEARIASANAGREEWRAAIDRALREYEETRLAMLAEIDALQAAAPAARMDTLPQSAP